MKGNITEQLSIRRSKSRLQTILTSDPKGKHTMGELKMSGVMSASSWECWVGRFSLLSTDIEEGEPSGLALTPSVATGRKVWICASLTLSVDDLVDLMRVF